MQSVASEKCKKESAACQTVMGEVMRYHVASQTTGKIIVDDLLKHDVGCQAIDKTRDVSCQTVELFRSNELDERENLSSESSAVEIKRKRDDEEGENRVMKRSTSCSSRLNCTDDDKILESSNNSGITKLLVLNLHPNVTEDDISVMFQFNFKSYQSTHINYYSNGKPLGTADIIFGDRADALKAKKKFNGKKLDGQPIDIVMLDPIVYDFIENGHLFEKRT